AGNMASELERIENLFTQMRPADVPEPTIVVSSGGGCQAFWRLAEPVQIGGGKAQWEELERYNQQLEEVFEGDHCWNIDRIMRLPGTVNIPDAKKRAKGRVKAVAHVVSFTDATYRLSDFEQATRADGGPPGAPPATSCQFVATRIADVSEL